MSPESGPRSGARVGRADRSPRSARRPAGHGRPAAERALAFLVGALVPTAFRLLLPGDLSVAESSDYRDFYEPVARSLLAGHGLVVRPGLPAVAYPPGYPVLLAVVFAAARLAGVAEPTALAASSTLLFGAAAVALHAAARVVWPDARALVVPCLWAVYPLNLWLAKQPNSEVPFDAVLFAALALFVPLVVGSRGGPGRAFACGVLLAVAALVRSIAVGLGAVLALALVVVGQGPLRRRALLAAVLVAGNVATLAPWVTWASIRTGRLVPVSTGGPPSVRDGLTFAVQTKGYRTGLEPPPDVAALMTRLEARAAELRSVGAIARVLAEEVGARPWAGAKLLAWKVGRSWYGTDSGRGERAVLAVQLVVLAVVLAATGRAARGRPAERRLAAIAWTVAAYTWAMTVVVLSIARYLVPAVGVLLLVSPALAPRAMAGPVRREPAVAPPDHSRGSSRVETTGVPSPCQFSKNDAPSGRSLKE